MQATDRWSTPRLAEFVAAITGAPDEATATRRAVEWATEALEAEIGVILQDSQTLASVGFGRGPVPARLLAAAVDEAAETVDIPGVGTCRLTSTRLDMESGADLVVLRAGTDPFSREEVGLLRAAARSLTVTLRLLGALDAERAARSSLQSRQALLERLSLIQRSITRRVPLADVLATITRSARDLLDVEVAALRLIDPLSPGDLVIASHEGLSPEVAVAARRSQVGEGAGGRAVTEDRLVIVEDYPTSQSALPGMASVALVRAMAAPVRDGDTVTGSIVVATTRVEHRFDEAHQEVLTAFAEHASLALTDAKRVEHIQHLAFHDELTGLANRGLFLERLEQALIRARRRRTHVAVLFLDLDRFKTINDSLGHAVGDLLLVEVGKRLAGCLRDEDTAARLGGDEFAILALCDRAGAVEVAHRVLTAMEPGFVIKGREVTASASIGIAMHRGGGGAGEATAMLRDADIAMYRAKQASDGFVVFEPSMHATALERIDLEADLRRAEERDQMRLDYQPIIRLADSSIIGVEALIRWHHDARGLIPPLDFIPLAEETGQIAALGRWTMSTASAQLRRWQLLDPSLRDLSVAVNVSPRELQDSRFVDDVAAAIERAELDPTRLVLEITEGAVMVDVERAIRRLGALRKLGVSLALDDFGTGQSSLALLRRLPVDIIKVDKLFVDLITLDATAAAMLENIIRLGTILAMEVVVEGIETAAQQALVALFGDVLGQGFQLGRPIDADDTSRLFAERLAASPPAGAPGSGVPSPRLVAMRAAVPKTLTG